MSTPEEKLAPKQQLILARSLDGDAAKFARDPIHGPLDEVDEPDAYDLMMGAPDIADFEPCSIACESICPCRRKPEDP